MTTKIEWTDETWNPITGCTHAGSPGCDNCYARRFAGRHLGVWGDQSDASNPERGFRQFSDIRLHEDRLNLPLRWKKPRRVFVNSMGDLFHPGVPFEWVDSVLAVVALCPQHTFQVSTKLAERMAKYFKRIEELSPKDLDKRFTRSLVLFDTGVDQDAWAIRQIQHGPLINLWLGVTAEDQARADERIPLLLQTPAAVRFVSVEPMLGAVDLNAACAKSSQWMNGRFRPLGKFSIGHASGLLDWIIAGGETGPGARPMHPDWVRGLRDQCQAAGVPFFFKGWGEWGPCADSEWHGLGPVGRPKQLCMGPTGDTAGGFLTQELADRRVREGWKPVTRVGKARAGRLLDGREWNEFPEVQS